MAAKEAAIRHAPLRVLAVHTVPSGWSGRGVPDPVDNELVVRTKAAAQELTDKVLAGIGGARPTGHGRCGQRIPADVLLRASEDADMIVLARAARRLRQAAPGIGQRPGAHHAHCPS